MPFTPVDKTRLPENLRNALASQTPVMENTGFMPFDFQEQEPPRQKKFGSGTMSFLGGMAKEAYKGVVRPLATPAAMIQSGITGEDVQYGDILGGAKASTDLNKNVRTGFGTALEAASLIPAGKALSGLRAATKAPLGRLAAKEAALGARAGALGASGYTLGQEEGSTFSDVLASGAMGGALGAGIGAAAPVVVKGLGKAWSWMKATDDIIDRSMKASGEDAAKAIKISEDLTEGKVSLLDAYPELEDLVPERAVDAVPIDPKLKKKAVKAGFKSWAPNILDEMSTAEREAAKAMLDIAEAKSENILLPGPIRKASEGFMAPFSHLRKTRQEAGQALDDLVDQMPKKPISLEEPTNLANAWLKSKNIRPEFNELGEPVGLDFSRSKFKGGASSKDRAAIREAWSALHPQQAKGEPIFRTPEEIRTLRQQLFLTLEKQKKATDPFSNEAEGFISSLRQQLNAPLATLSDEYAEANMRYAVASSGLDRFYRFLGRDFYDATEEQIMERMDELLRRFISGTKSKPGVIFRDLIESAKRAGMTDLPIEDPRRLIHLNNMLEDAFDIRDPGGFTESVARGGRSALGDTMQAGGDLMDLVNPVKALPAASRLTRQAIGMFSPGARAKRQQLLKDMIRREGVESLEEAVEGIPTAGKAGAAARAGKDEAFGGVAGIEPEFDEEGRPTGLGFSPEKAAAGVLGVAAVKRLGKRKSFDEWVKGQGEALYHGGAKEVSKIDDLIYVSPSKTQAIAFGRVRGAGKDVITSELYLRPDAKIKEIDFTPGLENKRQIAQAKNEGFDAVSFKEMGIDEQEDQITLAVINPKAIKTRSQLKAEWEKAGKKAIDAIEGKPKKKPSPKGQAAATAKTAGLSIGEAVDAYRRNSNFSRLEGAINANPKEAKEVADASVRFLDSRGIKKLYRTGTEDGISYSYTKAGLRNFANEGTKITEVPLTSDVKKRIIAVQGIIGDGEINPNEAEVILRPLKKKAT